MVEIGRQSLIYCICNATGVSIYMVRVKSVVSGPVFRQVNVFCLKRARSLFTTAEVGREVGRVFLMPTYQLKRFVSNGVEDNITFQLNNRRPEQENRFTCVRRVTPLHPDPVAN